MTPGDKDLWFLPLGGCGEIGMNLNLFGHAGQWLMVDCGVTFEDRDIVMPDPKFIAERSDQLAGIIATHAHEDHIGALPDLWQRFRKPIYTTPFTAHVIRRKMAEKRLDAPIIVVRPGDCKSIGAFSVQWLPITHSTPETNALLIRTPAGRILHTADWKIDRTPVVGERFLPSRFEALGTTTIDAVVCDSTNAVKAGRSVSEGDLYPGLLEEVEKTAGRVVIACFASNIARLQTLGQVAERTGRRLGLLGRSLESMSISARACGYLSEEFFPINSEHLGYLPPGEVLAVATGSQGEPRAALHRLAMDNHPWMNLCAGDKVIFSAKTIPGNEQSVAQLLSLFRQREVEVVHADESSSLLHATGHPCAGELADMYRWVKPALAIPVHGEDEHMQRNASIAADSGVPSQWVGNNGDLFVIAGEQPGVRKRAAPAGRLKRR